MITAARVVLSKTERKSEDQGGTTMHKLLSSTLILINTLFPVMAFGQAIDLAKAVGELTGRLVALSKGEVLYAA